MAARRAAATVKAGFVPEPPSPSGARHASRQSHHREPSFEYHRVSPIVDRNRLAGRFDRTARRRMRPDIRVVPVVFTGSMHRPSPQDAANHQRIHRACSLRNEYGVQFGNLGPLAHLYPNAGRNGSDQPDIR